MANKHLRRSPHKATDKGIGEACWWYEEPGGIQVIIERHRFLKDGSTAYSYITIPWKSLRKALARKEKP